MSCDAPNKGRIFAIPIFPIDASAHTTHGHSDYYMHRIALFSLTAFPSACLPVCLPFYLSVCLAGWLNSCLSQQAPSGSRSHCEEHLQGAPPVSAGASQCEQGATSPGPSPGPSPSSCPATQLTWAPQIRETLQRVRRCAAGGVRAEWGKARLVGSSDGDKPAGYSDERGGGGGGWLFGLRSDDMH